MAQFNEFHTHTHARICATLPDKNKRTKQKKQVKFRSTYTKFT